MRVVVAENLSNFGLPANVATYKVTCTKHELGASKKGDPMLTLTYRVDSQGPTEEKTVGKLINDRILMLEDFLWKLDQVCKAASGSGMPRGEFELEELISLVAPMIVGKSFLIEVGPGKGEFANRGEIKKYNPNA